MGGGARRSTRMNDTALDAAVHMMVRGRSCKARLQPHRWVGYEEGEEWKGSDYV